MNIRELTCIGCPMGCQLRATLEDGVVTAVTGNTCPRGDAYARKECVHPERTVTGTVRVLGGPLPVVPVRTQGEVPKEKVLEVARALHHAAVPAPVQAGQVVLADVSFSEFQQQISIFLQIFREKCNDHSASS